MSHKNQYQSIQGSVQHSIMLNPALNLFSGSFQGLTMFSRLFQHLIHRAKPLMIHFTLIVGLCFGQVEESTRGVTLSMPLSMYLGQPVDNNRLTMRRISLMTQISPSDYLTLMLQIEGDSLQPRTSFWKQTGIYGLEFLGAGGGALTCYVASKLMAEGMHGSEFAPPFALCYYTISSIIITPTCTWATGKLFKQKGHWWKSVIGTGVGWGLYYCLSANDVKMSDAWYLTFKLLTPSLGAVVGFNL